MQSTCIQLSQLSHCIHLWALPDARSSSHVVRHPVLKSFDVSVLDSSGTLKLGMVEKLLWEKEKMLVTSIFSFSHNVFTSPLLQGH